MIPALIAAGATLAGGAMSNIFQSQANKKNEALMREAWARDDTKQQRLVADLEAAGLNKQLAAGMGGTTSSPIQVASQSGDYIGQAAQRGLEQFTAEKQREQIQKQTELLSKQNEMVQSQITAQNEQNRVLKHDADIVTNSPFRSNDPAALQYLRVLVDEVKGDGQLFNTLKSRLDDVGLGWLLERPSSKLGDTATELYDDLTDARETYKHNREVDKKQKEVDKENKKRSDDADKHRRTSRIGKPVVPTFTTGDMQGLVSNGYRP